MGTHVPDTLHMCSQPHNQWDHEPTLPCRSSSCFLNPWAGSSIALIDTKYRGVSSWKILSAKPCILSFNICTNYGTEGQSGNHGKQLHPTYMPQFCHFSTVDEEGQSKKLSLLAKLLHTNSHHQRVYCCTRRCTKCNANKGGSSSATMSNIWTEKKIQAWYQDNEGLSGD